MVQTTNNKTATTEEVAARFNELAQQEKWSDIQNQFFSENIRSIDPEHSPYFGCAEGKAEVLKKGVEFLKGVETVHRAFTSEPLVCGNHFCVARELDMTLKAHGRIQLNEMMLYEVKDGQIVSEQFFY